MFAKIWALIEVIKALFSLWREFSQWKERERQKKISEEKKIRDKAIDALLKADTQKDFDDAQKDIVSSKPS
jgi:ABC-type transport system involved in Fe-S cluster assembly fused permease/ATPase subunit